MIIDAHVHVWGPTRASYPWLGPGNARTVGQGHPFVSDAISQGAGGYQRTWEATTDILTGVDRSAREAIMSGTAARVYGLT